MYMAVAPNFELRCPRNSKNNDGSSCYCLDYPHPLYHGVASKDVICCYADGECCYQDTCCYSHIKPNKLPMPCIFELNGRRCNNPRKCIFMYSFHQNRRIPKKTEQVYRHDIKHVKTNSRFPRSKKRIDEEEFDSNPINSNTQIKAVYIPISANSINNNNVNNHHPNGIIPRKVGKTVNIGARITQAAKVVNNAVIKDTKRLKNLKSSKGLENVKNVKCVKDKSKQVKIEEKELKIEEMDDAVIGLCKYDLDEIKMEEEDEIERTKEQYKRRGLKMPFSERIRIKQKYKNMQKQLKENEYYANKRKNDDYNNPNSLKLKKLNIDNDNSIASWDKDSNYNKLRLNTLNEWNENYHQINSKNDYEKDFEENSESESFADGSIYI